MAHGHITMTRIHLSRSAVIKKITGDSAVLAVLTFRSNKKFKLINLQLRHNITSYLVCFYSSEENAVYLEQYSCGGLFLNELVLLNKSTE